MSTHIGSFSTSISVPVSSTALVKVAMIGAWQGRTFLDDDNDLADVADFVPDELAPPSAAQRSRRRRGCDRRDSSALRGCLTLHAGAGRTVPRSRQSPHTSARTRQ